MSSFAPIRDAAGGIIGMQPRDESLFTQTLAETMTAVGAANTEPEPKEHAPARRSFGRLELAGAAAGLLLAAILIAALNTFAPAPAPRLAPTATIAPTAAPTTLPTPVLQDAYASPGGALLGGIPLTATLAYQHSAWPGWAGVAWQGGVIWVQTDRDLAGLPDLAPPPTRAPPIRPPVEAPAAAPPAPAEPAAVCDPLVNPPYVVKVAVTGEHGEPLGSATGVSCESQAEAETNAAMLADQVRATFATAEAADRPQPTPSAR